MRQAALEKKPKSTHPNAEVQGMATPLYCTVGWVDFWTPLGAFNTKCQIVFDPQIQNFRPQSRVVAIRRAFLGAQL